MANSPVSVLDADNRPLLIARAIVGLLLPTARAAAPSVYGTPFPRNGDVTAQVVKSELRSHHTAPGREPGEDSAAVGLDYHTTACAARSDRGAG
jgi:hypothetical protein